MIDLSHQELPVVLIVDDDPSVRRALGGVLRGNGFTTAEAATVGAAIAATEQQSLAAVVLDLTLEHGESGLDFLSWLRQRPDHGSTPVLILTGRTTLEAGDQDLIQRYRAYVFYKPHPFSVLVEYLKRLTTGHQP
ncbi:MAG TPA: response regulator [Vicinamibacterales bacterium]